MITLTLIPVSVVIAGGDAAARLLSLEMLAGRFEAYLLSILCMVGPDQRPAVIKYSAERNFLARQENRVAEKSAEEGDRIPKRNPDFSVPKKPEHCLAKKPEQWIVHRIFP